MSFVPPLYGVITYTILSENQTNLNAELISRLNQTQRKILEGVLESNRDTKEEIQGLQRDLSRLAKEQSRSARLAEDKKKEARQILVDQWQTQNQETINFVLSTFHEKEASQKSISYRRKVLDSLYFERIEERENMIDESYQKTLRWVFDPTPAIRSRWSDFPGWLRGSDGLYWVSGKAGSGKSTLMKWIVLQDRTKELLDIWADGKQLLLARHFFWNPGSEVQKSLAGLMRSILYDLLLQHPESISQISPARWRFYDLELAHFPSWTDHELMTAMRIFVQSTLNSSRVCLFVDGLDEFAGNDDQLVNVLELFKELSLLPNVKICVSSRPWEVFKDAFTDLPSLRLEHLTQDDIRDYVNERFGTNDKVGRLKEEENMLCSELVNEIVRKAQGVWLWVVLVVRSLLRGLRNRDSVSDLLQRLEETPQELEEYFMRMLSTIEKTYRLKSLKLLKIALHCTPSLMTLSYLDYDNEIDMPRLVAPKLLSFEQVHHRLELTTKRVNIRCLDLLEVDESVSKRPIHAVCKHHVSFWHRTAQDFLLDLNNQHLLGMEMVSSFDVPLFLCQAILAQIKSIDPPLPYTQLVSFFMSYATTLERTGPSALLPLLHDLNASLDDQRSRTGVLQESGSLVVGPFGSWQQRVHGPMPLLTLAIEFDLATYVADVLSSCPDLVFKQPGRPILDFALRRSVSSLDRGIAEQADAHRRPNPELVQLILKQGCDPNMSCGKSTVWKCFVEFLDILGEVIAILPKQEQQPWIDVTELLIRYGAVRVLETQSIIHNQPAGRTRVRLRYREKLARDSFKVAFGEVEANRLDSLSWWMNATGQNLATNVTRSISSSVRWLSGK